MWQSFAGNEDEAIQAEHAVGRDMATVVKEQAREQGTSDPEFQVLLDDIAKPLAERVKNRNHRFEVTVLLSDNPTAFALPGGFIFIAPALVELAEKNADELAFVIGYPDWKSHRSLASIRRHEMARKSLFARTRI